jgi:hypothetical protein
MIGGGGLVIHLFLAPEPKSSAQGIATGQLVQTWDAIGRCEQEASREIQYDVPSSLEASLKVYEKGATCAEKQA